MYNKDQTSNEGIKMEEVMSQNGYMKKLINRHRFQIIFLRVLT